MQQVETRDVTIITEPTIFVVADMQIRDSAYLDLITWLRSVDPGCLDEKAPSLFDMIFPHQGEEEEQFASRPLTHNELLVELAGRGCYRSYGLKAGRRSNAEYISNLMGSPGNIPHASVTYHAKMTFFFAGLSRRVSHELIRHYVGADRSEEGSPSQESTRFTHHPGHYVIHPRDIDDTFEAQLFRKERQAEYDKYLAYVSRQFLGHKEAHGEEAKGMARKRIYEAAASRLGGAAATSFYWTTNPTALAKIIWERTDDASDLEIQRFARKLKVLCEREWPNLFRGSNWAQLALAHEPQQVPR